jgi:hypothetical protein
MSVDKRFEQRAPGHLTANERYHQFDIEFFVVCHEAQEGNRRILNKHLSPLYSSMAKALAALPAIKAEYPDAGIGGGRIFFHPDNTEDMVRRDELLRSLE